MCVIYHPVMTTYRSNIVAQVVEQLQQLIEGVTEDYLREFVEVVADVS